MQEPYLEHTPRIHPTAFVHETAVVIGDVGRCVEVTCAIRDPLHPPSQPRETLTGHHPAFGLA